MLLVEQLKEASRETINFVTALEQQLWGKKAWPQNWKRLVYFPIPRKGDLKGTYDHLANIDI